MKEQPVIEMGLIALARAGFRDSPYLGHFGLGMLASHFMCQEIELSPETVLAVENCRFALIAQEPALFEGGEARTPNPASINRFRDYLLAHIEDLSRSGHIAIVGMFSLKAFQTEPTAATDNRVGGIIRLLEAYGKERPEPRYYGIPGAYRILSSKVMGAVPEYHGATDAFDLSINETVTLYPDMEINGVFYYFTGEKLHAITHAHALYELERMDEFEIAKRGYTAHRLQIALNRAEPTGIDPINDESNVTPDSPEFWAAVPIFEHQLGIPHAFKRSFAFLRARQIGLPSIDDKLFRKLSYVLHGW